MDDISYFKCVMVLEEGKLIRVRIEWIVLMDEMGIFMEGGVGLNR